LPSLNSTVKPAAPAIAAAASGSAGGVDLGGRRGGRLEQSRIERIQNLLALPTQLLGKSKRVEVHRLPRLGRGLPFRWRQEDEHRAAAYAARTVRGD
jgi:hypothetical protein